MRTSRFVDTATPKNGRTAKLRGGRSGAVLVAVLTCVLIVVALIGGAIKCTLTARRQCKLELQMQQAELLLQAGIDRISSKVSNSTDDADAVFASLPTWDARAALPEFAIAEVSYQRSSADDGATTGIRCTARLGVSTSPEHVIQVSRDWKLTNIQPQVRKSTL
jgi:Tfp pilus assembly protein PilX